MYDSILVPTDGSDASEGAVEHAIELATQYDATLHALYVVDTGAYSSLEMGAEIVAEALQEEGKKAVDRIETAAEEAGVSVEATVKTGLAHRSIVDYVDEEGIDLVVMGTHGRTGVGRFLLGSVAEKVIRTADAPVMTVRTPKSADEEESEE
ncbi:universal stress protein [Halobellus marinus]|uniref:universal stress protein n=1 Tax=Halobellus TaxID=1073986 RepID=UPI0028B04403|nr:universal stress protein [Halobellus sp. DFY28]